MMNKQQKRTSIFSRKIVAIFGLVLMGLSFFLPWLTAKISYVIEYTLSNTGFHFFPEIGVLAIIFLVIGSLIVWFYHQPKHSGIVCLGIGVWMLIETLYVYSELQNVISLSTDFVMVQLGFGFYLLPVSVVIILIGGILLIAAKTEVRPLVVNQPRRENTSEFSSILKKRKRGFCLLPKF